MLVQEALSTARNFSSSSHCLLHSGEKCSFISSFFPACSSWNLEFLRYRKQFNFHQGSLRLYICKNIKWFRAAATSKEGFLFGDKKKKEYSAINHFLNPPCLPHCWWFRKYNTRHLYVNIDITIMKAFST